MSTFKSITINLDSLTANNLGIFNRITAPTEYPDSYIQECKDSGELAKYAYFSEVPVGILVLKSIVNKSPIALQVSLMKVLEAYSWKYGVERTFLKYALELCPKRHVSNCAVVVNKNNTRMCALLEELGFHVEVNNKDIYLISCELNADSVVYVKNV
jgi:ribosomal protein S18 acetylase RimI-like enzyme